MSPIRITGQRVAAVRAPSASAEEQQKDLDALFATPAPTVAKSTSTPAPPKREARKPARAETPRAAPPARTGGNNVVTSSREKRAKAPRGRAPRGRFGPSLQVQLNFRTSPQLRDRLAKLAKDLGQPINGIIEAAVIAMLA